MDLYYTLTYYHILCALLHKQYYNRNESILIISSLTYNHEQMKLSIQKLGIFKKVFILKDEFPNTGKIDNTLLSDPEYINRVIDEFNTLFLSNISIDISKFSERYIWADHFPLGIYLNANNLPYNYFEDGCGQMSRVEETVSKMDLLSQKAVAEYLQLFGRSNNVQKRYINFEMQESGYTFTDKDTDFSVERLVSHLSQKQRENIFKVFDVPAYAFDTELCESVLFCPQHNVNLKLFTVEQQIYQTALLLDFFAGNAEVYIKPHPNDIFTDYKELGKKVNIISGSFPAELLSLCVNGKFKKGITAWSTSIYSLAPILETSICFTSEIDDDFYSLYRYYLVCKVLSKLIKKQTVIYTLGVNVKMIENMLSNSDCFCDHFNLIDLQPAEITCMDVEKETLFDNFCRGEDYGILIDDPAMGEVEIWKKFHNEIFHSKVKFIIFINSKNEFVFFDGTNYEIFLNMIRLVIEKRPLNEFDIYTEINTDEEDIWVYSKDNDIRETVSNLSYVKELPYSKMITRINMAGEEFAMPDADSLYRNIKMLEGILAATERRVLSELEKSNYLEAELESCRKEIDTLSERLQKYEGKKEDIETVRQENEILNKELELLELQTENQILKEKIIKAKYGKDTNRDAALEN